MHPERDGVDWEPIYNVIEIERRDDERIGLRLFQRRWHKTDCRFVADHDPDNGKPHRDHVWQVCLRPARGKQRAVESSEVTRPELAVSTVVAVNTTAKDSDAMPPPNHERRLT